MAFDLKREVNVSRKNFDGTMNSFQSLSSASGMSHEELAAARSGERDGKFVSLAPLRPQPTSFAEDGPVARKARMQYSSNGGYRKEDPAEMAASSIKSRRLPGHAPFAPDVRSIGFNDKGDMLVSDTDFARSRKQKFVEAHIPPAPVPSKMHTHTHEVQVLEKWMKKMFSQNVKKSVETSHVLNDLHVHSLCFHEAVRQTCVHCMDLGRILASIWNGYIELFERTFSHYHRRLALVEAENVQLTKALKETEIQRDAALKQNEELESRYGAVQRALADKDEKMKVYDENNRILEQECNRMRRLIDLVGDADRQGNPSTLAPELNNLSAQLTTMVEDIDLESERTNQLLSQMNVLFEYALETEQQPGGIVRTGSTSGTAPKQSKFKAKEFTTTVVQTELTGTGTGALPVKCPKCGIIGHAAPQAQSEATPAMVRQSSNARIGMSGFVTPSGFADNGKSGAQGPSGSINYLPQPLSEFVGMVVREKSTAVEMNPVFYLQLTNRLTMEKSVHDGTIDDPHKRRTIPEFVHDFITRMYGSKSSVDNRVMALVNTTRKLAKVGNVKARVFGRLIGALPGKMMSMHQMNNAIYINGMLQHNKDNVQLTEKEGDKIRMHPLVFVRAILNDTYSDVKPELLEAVQNDLSKLAQNDMIAQEVAVEASIKLFDKSMDRVLDDLRTAFRNSDARGDGVFNLDEFTKMLDVLMGEIVPPAEVQTMFNDCFAASGSGGGASSDKILEQAFVDMAVYRNMHPILKKQETMFHLFHLTTNDVDDYVDLDRDMLNEAVNEVKNELRDIQKVVEGTPDEREMRKIYNRLKEFMSQSSATAVEQSWNLYRQLVLAINRISVSLQDYKK